MSFKNLQEQVATEINTITEDVINKLIDIWTETFDIDICQEHLKTLSKHVSIFYQEVITEVIQRQDKIKEDINRLHKEASTLQRLLNVDVVLSPQKGVPLFTTFHRLDDSLKDLRERLKLRKDQIQELLFEQDSLCEDLGENPKPLLDDPLPTEEELQDFRLHLDSLKGEKVNRLYEISTLRRDIKNFLSELGLSLQSETEIKLLNDRHIALTKTNLNRLCEIREEYANQMEEQRESIETMKKKLEILWDCLETSLSVRQKFAKYKDYSQTTYDKLYTELDRCETQKRQNIKIFVDRIREEILVWWDKTKKSDKERARFTNFTNDCYTEELLTLHEMELDDLKKFYNDHMLIFDLINERQILWDRMIALEAKATEPGRFNNRGGQLLKEERERKTIATKLPKIESRLSDLVHQYESQHKRTFMANGEPVMELIAKDWDKRHAEKEKHMSARKCATANTPLSKTLMRTPLSGRNFLSATKHISSISRILSTKSKTASKRKADTPSENMLPTVKRSLMPELESSTNFLRPLPVKPKVKTTPSKKMRVLATTIRRKSARQSGSSKSRRKSNRFGRNNPKIVIGSSDTSVSSYDKFEEHIAKEPTSRSSIFDNTTLNTNFHKSKLADPSKMLRTPSKTNLNQMSMRTRSPALSRTGTCSPSAGHGSRKLTTKNLPILI